MAEVNFVKTFFKGVRGTNYLLPCLFWGPLVKCINAKHKKKVQ